MKEYTVKDLMVLSKNYGYSGKHTSTIRRLIKSFGIKPCSFIKNTSVRNITKLYNEKVYKFFELYFDIQNKKKALYLRIKDYNKLFERELKKVQK